MIKYVDQEYNFTIDVTTRGNLYRDMLDYLESNRKRPSGIPVFTMNTTTGKKSMEKVHSENLKKLEFMLNIADSKMSESEHNKNINYDYWYNRYIIAKSQISIYKCCLNKAPLATNYYDIVH